MINSLDISSEFALDVSSLGKLRLAAKTDNNEAIKAAAKQFESLFLNMMLKSMREAIPKGGLLDNSQTDLFTGLLDQQMSQKFSSGGGVGLADMMVKQLTRSQVLPSDGNPVTKSVESGFAAARRSVFLTSSDPLFLKA